MRRRCKAITQWWTALDDPELKTTEKLIYQILCRFQGDHIDCYPSHKTISEQCNKSITAVKRALSGLERKGYIQKTRQKRPDGGTSSNRYICLK